MRFSSDIVSAASGERDAIAAELRAFVAAPDFPCVGAKAALRKHQLEIFVASDIKSTAYDRIVTHRLQDFAGQRDVKRAIFVSQAVIYHGQTALTELEFETFLWQRLTAFHTIDVEDFQ